MHHRRNNQVRPDELRQRVRRFPRDELLRGIARAASQETLLRKPLRDRGELTISLVRERYLFQLAGICVTNCNNHRRRTVDADAVEDLLQGLYNVWPPELDRGHGVDAWQRILSRTVYLQMPYQMSQAEPLSRSLCLFGNDPRFGEPVFEDGRWEAILGVPLEEFLKIAFIMFTAAIHNSGGISRQTLLSENVRPAFEPVGAEQALTVIDSWLARPVDDLARLDPEMTPDPDDLWRFNPFYEWPIAILNDGTYVMPSPLGVMQRLGPQGLYFLGRDADPDGFGAFATDLGDRFERYIGAQLEFIQHARVRPEIVYDDDKRSVDYIIETAEVLILVEVKSAAPDIKTRSGIFPEKGEMQQKIAKACRQITTSADRIDEGHPDFPVLASRPMRGLVVTREPYFNLLIPFMTDVVQPASIPTTIVSSQQLEGVIPALSDDMDCGTSLLGALASDPETVNASLDPLPLGRNQLLGEIRDRWFDEHRLRDPEESLD